MAKTITEELKDFYVKLGGNREDVANLQTISEILDAIEQIYHDNGDTLPIVTTDDDGKVLKVVEGIWDKADENELPTITSADNDKVLIAKEGEWVAQSPSLNPQKIYYAGDTIIQNIGGMCKNISVNNSHDYYIDENGDLVSSSSNSCKKVDLSKYTPLTVTVQSASTSFYSYAFYSSTDTFDSTTFISGGKVSTAKSDTTFTISEIPQNAVVMLVVRYSSTAYSITGYEGSDYSYDTVSNAIEAWKADEYPRAVIYKKEAMPTNIYYVGANRTPSSTEFNTVIGAVAQWVTDGKPTATIYVDNGTYITISDSSSSAENPLQIIGGENRLTIVGESKDATIIKSTTGKYIHPAIDIQGGNVTLKNITFIADHSTNSTFMYALPSDTYNHAYAVHCDSGTVAGLVEIENCNMWSWQSCGLGCGTIPNSQIVVKECDIRSFVPGTATDEGSASGTSEEIEAHGKYVSGSRGALVYHTSSSATGTSNEGFTLINSSVYIRGGLYTLKLTNGNSSSDFKMITFINNTFSNGIVQRNGPHIEGTFNRNRLSKGNNINSLNNSSSDYELLIK